MTALLHLSDLHFGTETRAACDALSRLTAQLQPDALVVSGDLTQRATERQYDHAARWIASLPAKHRLVLPGNHDLPLHAPLERLMTPYRRFSARFGDVLEPALHFDGVQVIGVDTTRKWRQQRGSVQARQVDAVASRLRDAPPGTWRIVVTHHPLSLAPGAERHGLARHRGDALAAWRAAGVDLLLSGHAHRPAVVALGDGLWSVHAGTAVSRRTKPGVPNSVNVLTQEPGEAGPARRITRYELEPSGVAFVEAGTVDVTPRRAPDGASPVHGPTPT